MRMSGSELSWHYLEIRFAFLGCLYNGRKPACVSSLPGSLRRYFISKRDLCREYVFKASAIEVCEYGCMNLCLLLHTIYIRKHIV